MASTAAPRAPTIWGSDGTIKVWPITSSMVLTTPRLVATPPALATGGTRPSLFTMLMVRLARAESTWLDSKCADPENEIVRIKIADD